MHHQLSELHLLSGLELIEKIKSTPKNATSLDLKYNSLGKRAEAEVVEALAAIPANVTSLNLRNNSFASNTNLQLERIFKAIPATVTSLNVSFNHFHSKGAEIVQVFKALPPTIKIITISEWDISTCPDADLATLVKALPSGTTINVIDFSEGPSDGEKAHVLMELFARRLNELTEAGQKQASSLKPAQFFSQKSVSNVGRNEVRGESNLTLS